MAEPLGYYSSKTGSKIMNSVTSIDLGLEDRPYIDWVRADKCCYIRNEAIIVANANADTFVKAINKTGGMELALYPALFLGLTYALVVNRP